MSAEVASHRFVTAPRERRGERVDASADLSAACPRLAAWPRCCNGCGRYRAIGCKRRPHVFYEARAAQLCADSVLVSSRRGIDADEPAAAEALALIRDGLGRGLSPEQLSARNGGPVDLSPSTIYRWVSAGYDGMTNMELRRKVGYRPRRHAPAASATRHSPRRSHAAFLALGEDACAAAWEMDTVEGPGGLRLPAHAAAPPQQAPARAAAGGEDRRVRRGRPGGRPGGPRRRRDAPRVPRRAHRQRPRVLRRGRDRRAHRRGAGRDEAVLLRPRRSDQKGACERNHVEIRKLLPKGRGLRFDRLAPADLALAMSHVNSEPRGALGFATPARAFRAMLGGDAAALLEAYGIEDVPIDELDLTPGLIERARAERAMPRCPSLRENGIG